MTTQDIVKQAELDAAGLREECLAEGREFSLLSTDDWDAVAFAELGLGDDECESAWPVYSDALRSAIRSIGGRA